MSTILIIEDEIPISKMLCMNLSVTGYQTIPFYDGQEALGFLERGGRGDLALVDVMLPGIDGFALLEPLTARDIPVIFLTARGEIEAKLRGLTGGAEDYMVKPFDMLELLVRIDKVLKRRGTEEVRLASGDITVDTRTREAWRAGGLLGLTPMEFDLLVLFLKNRRVALSRDFLLSTLWGATYEGSTRTVDVHVAQLRKKTGLNLVAIPKVGYRLEEKE